MAKRHLLIIPLGLGLAGLFLSDVQTVREGWNSYFKLSYSKDRRPVSGTLYVDTGLGRIPFEVKGEDVPRDRITIQSGAEYLKRITGRTFLRAGVRGEFHQKKGSRYDEHTLESYFGPMYYLDKHTRISLLPTVERKWVGSSPDADKVGAKIELEKWLNPKTNTKFEAYFKNKNARMGSRLDGPEVGGKVTLEHLIHPKVRVRASLNAHEISPQEKDFRYSAQGGEVGATVLLPGKLVLDLSASISKKQYEGDGRRHYTLDRRSREDTDTTLEVSIHNPELELYGFSPRLYFRREDTDTNAQLLSGGRNTVGVDLVRPF